MKVTLYRSTDGQLHETYAAYAKHEASLKIAAAVKIAELDMGMFGTDDASNVVLYAADVAAFIADNADVLRAILNGSAIPVRGRKAKTATAAV